MDFHMKLNLFELDKFAGKTRGRVEVYQKNNPDNLHYVDFFVDSTQDDDVLRAASAVMSQNWLVSDWSHVFMGGWSGTCHPKFSAR